MGQIAELPKLACAACSACGMFFHTISETYLQSNMSWYLH